jgi:ankyrin repeat protein
VKGACQKLLAEADHVPEGKHYAEQMLAIAIFQRDANLTRWLLSVEGIDPNLSHLPWTWAQTDPPLIHAILLEDLNLVQLLLECPRIDVNVRDHGLAGMTPLLRAVQRGREDFVRLLLEDELLDIDAEGGPGHRTPLSLAAHYGETNIFKLLLAKGADPELTWAAGTPLFEAAKGGHEEIVRLLLMDERVDPNYRHLDGETPLSVAKTDTIADLLRADKRFDPTLHGRPGP